MNCDEFVSELESLESNLWGGAYIRVPDEIATNYIDGRNKRVISRLNDAISIQTALLSSADGFYFIRINKKVINQLALLIGQKIKVKIEKDNSKYGLPMPEEFREVLNQDEVADTYFHKLTAGKQRSLLHIAGNVKNPDKRIERALAIAFHLTKNKGVIDFTELMQDLKDFRNR